MTFPQVSTFAITIGGRELDRSVEVLPNAEAHRLQGQLDAIGITSKLYRNHCEVTLRTQDGWLGPVPVTEAVANPIPHVPKPIKKKLFAFLNRSGDTRASSPARWAAGGTSQFFGEGLLRAASQSDLDTLTELTHTAAMALATAQQNGTTDDVVSMLAKQAKKRLLHPDARMQNCRQTSIPARHIAAGMPLPGLVDTRYTAMLRLIATASQVTDQTSART